MFFGKLFNRKNFYTDLILVGQAFILQRISSLQGCRSPQK